MSTNPQNIIVNHVNNVRGAIIRQGHTHIYGHREHANRLSCMKLPHDHERCTNGTGYIPQGNAIHCGTSDCNVMTCITGSLKYYNTCLISVT